MTRIFGAGGGCFPAGVMVSTPRGEVPIETLEVGDEVISFDHSGRLSISTVQRLHYHANEKVVIARYWGGALRVTANHWVLNQYNAFVEIGTLTDEDALVDSAGHLRPVIAFEDDGEEPVYNLTVTPDHTYIAGGIRVHNGGGGKGGGGSSHVPTEDPDTLQSHQYARVLDLVSEGEIGGLVNGLKSVYLNDTVLMNDDGTYNFTGVTFDSRTGTQIQTPLADFADVESEVAVTAEVLKDQPIVRTITNPNVDAARVTVAIPALSFQDPTTGDLKGTSVKIGFDVRSASSGVFKSMPMGTVWTAAPHDPIYTLTNDYSVQNCFGLTIDVEFQHNFALGTLFPLTPGRYNPVSYLVRYVEGWHFGTIPWIVLESGTLQPPASTPQFDVEGNRLPETGNMDISKKTFTLPNNLVSSPSTFTIQVVINSGGAVKSMSGRALTYTYEGVISGKATSRYRRAYDIPLEGTGPWDIRMVRYTADSTKSNLQNETWWDSYTEVIHTKLSYPNSAIMALMVDAQQFRSIPSRGYEIYGLKVRYPSNYNPFSRTYSGVWDGTFSYGWCNNPAWVYYDLATNDRYGTGAFVDESLLDKWELYDIGRYCDELVPDGFGRFEPRFTCNIYLQTREEAYKVLANLASVFRGITFWSAGGIATVADKPTDPIKDFTAANVIDGMFNYSGSSLKTRHTVALVTWNDPSDRYKQKIEYVEDYVGITKYGVVEAEVVAFGCTSRSQAHRVGKWLLYTERAETEVVTFKTGLEGNYIYPGSVIRIADGHRAGERRGGRLLQTGTSSVTLDDTIQFDGTTMTLTVMMPDGTLVDRTVAPAAPTDTLTLSPPLPEAPVDGSIWLLASDDLEPQIFRVIAVTEADSANIEISALAHDIGKYDFIEKDIVLQPTNTISDRLLAPTPYNLTAKPVIYTQPSGALGVKTLLSWESTAGTFDITYRKDSENPVTLRTYSPFVEIPDTNIGSYEFRVWALNALGQRSSAAVLQYAISKETITQNVEPLANITNLNAVIKDGVLRLTWARPTDPRATVFEIRRGTSFATGVVMGRTSNAYFDTAGDGDYWVAAYYNNPIMGVMYSPVPASIDIAGSKLPNNILVTKDFRALGWPGLPNFPTVVFKGDVGLSGTTLFSTVPKVSDLISFLVNDPIASEGYYDPGEAHEVDITDEGVCGISVNYFAASDRPLDLFSMIPVMSEEPTIAGGGGGMYDVAVQFAMAKSDGIYGDWRDFEPGNYLGRKFKFRAKLNSYNTRVTPLLKKFTITVDMPDRLDSGNDVQVAAAGQTITFGKKFSQVPPNVQITILNAVQGDTVLLSSPTVYGFTVQVKNGGVGVQRSINWLAKGY